MEKRVSASIGMGNRMGRMKEKWTERASWKSKCLKNISQHTPPSIDHLVTLQILIEREGAYCVKNILLIALSLLSSPTGMKLF